MCAAVQLREACAGLRDRLKPISDAPEIEAARFPFWQPGLSHCASVTGPRGRVVRQDSEYSGYEAYPRRGWAAAAELPITGRAAFSFLSADGPGSALPSYAFVGVCTADGKTGWGYVPANGNVWQWSLEADGGMRYCRPLAVPPAFRGVRASSGQHTMATGHGARLMHRPLPVTRVNCVLDMDTGKLLIALNDGVFERVLDGFPPGQALRPWTCLDGAGLAVQIASVVAFNSPRRRGPAQPLPPPQPLPPAAGDVAGDNDENEAPAAHAPFALEV